MKTTIGIILGAVLGAIIVTGVTLWMVSSLFSPRTQESPSNVAITTPQTTITPPAPLTIVPSTISPTLPPITGESPAQSGVNFKLNINNFSISGLNSGTVDAQITNTGTSDAHNVWVKLEIIYQGSIIKIGGQDYFRKDLGTIKPGETVTSQVNITVSLTDGIKIAQNGSSFRLTVYSDEKTQTLTYDYHP
jgi:hypothetical protein